MDGVEVAMAAGLAPGRPRVARLIDADGADSQAQAWSRRTYSRHRICNRWDASAWCIMGSPVEVHLVVATNGTGSRFWAVATPRDRAMELVRGLAAPDCTIALSDRMLSPEQVTALKVKSGQARELPFGPRPAFKP